MAVIQIAVAIFLYLTLALRQEPLSALRASAYAAAVTWPLLCLWAPAPDRRRHSLVLIYLAIGISLPGLVSLVASALQMPRRGSLVAYFAALYLAAAVRSYRSSRRAAAAAIEPHRIARSEVLGTLALCCVAVAPTLVYAIYMGRGDHPAVFFNADNPYHLSHVWSMLRDPGYPVMSLGVFGERRTYQYGAQAAATVLSLASDLPPHTTYLGVIYPLYRIATIASAWQLGLIVFPRVPLWMSAGLLAVFSRFPLDVREMTAAWRLLAGHWPTPPPINLFGIDHVLTLFGMFTAVLLVAALAAERETPLRIPAFLSVALLPIFKMSFFLGIGAALAAWLTVQAIRARSLRPLVPGLATLAVAFLVVRLLSLHSGETSGQLVLSPFAHLRDLTAPIVMKINGAFGEPTLALTFRGLRIVTTDYAVGFHWLIISAAAVTIACWRNLPDRWAGWAAVALAPVVFMNTVKYVRGPIDNESIRSSIDVTFTLVPYLMVAAALALIASSLPALTRTRRRVLQTIFATYVLVLAATNISAAATLLLEPSAGYERADNSAIAPALQSIPADRALIVTNDTRYPASNFASRDLQMQIPAIYGHRAYFVDGVNDRFEGSDARRTTQEMLREKAWPPDLVEIARTRGWTHFLMRRDSPHADVIPLKLVYENSDYRVFAF